ncbi:MAG TPA: amidohydrolase, partial [Gemmatimonadales bacterium]|nr:amidohydrolase [Gemmatimonadales bacterium]
PVTAHVRAADSVWPQDPAFSHALAAGITTVLVLPGSANLVGGQGVTLKLHPGRSVADMQFPGAPPTLKMACGENPKRVYRNSGPSTRMGNMAGYRAAFIDAEEYRKKWDAYNKDRKGDPPSRDLQLETLAGVLRGDILVHNHCYRADEMAQIIDLSKEFGFKVRSFHHAVEGYKIADLLAKEGIAASVWADWCCFKMESFDAVPQNAALLQKAGTRTIIHSDDAIGIQRLNQEAAKAMYAGQQVGIPISREEAIKWITINPAWALGIDSVTGSLEAGKAADVVLWSGDPFSIYSKAEQVYNDGWLVYDRNDPNRQPQTDFNLGLTAPGVGQ